MVSFPNAKINLGLHILGKRSTGYHDIETFIYPIPWLDILEIVPSEEEDITTSGIHLTNEPTSNLCWKAYEILKDEYDLPPVRIHLHKNIPPGAGLGGGSADGAFTLTMLNRIFSLRLSANILEQFASKIGSDCPFFISNRSAIATGTGTQLKPVKLDLKSVFLAVVYPQIKISTPDAYNMISIRSTIPKIEKIPDHSAREWIKSLENHFESYVFGKYPELGELKELLLKSGAWYASLTGSGSAVYGFFDNQPQIFNLPKNYTLFNHIL